MERGTRNAQAQKAMPCRQLTGEKLLANWTAKILQLGSKKGVCLPSPGLQRSERSAFHAIRVVTKTKTGTGTKTKTGTGVIHIMRQSGRKRSGARSDNPCGNGILVVTLHRQKPETPPKGMEGGRRKKINRPYQNHVTLWVSDSKDWAMEEETSSSALLLNIRNDYSPQYKHC